MDATGDKNNSVAASACCVAGVGLSGAGVVIAQAGEL